MGSRIKTTRAFNPENGTSTIVVFFSQKRFVIKSICSFGRLKNDEKVKSTMILTSETPGSA